MFCFFFFHIRWLTHTILGILVYYFFTKTHSGKKIRKIFQNAYIGMILVSPPRCHLLECFPNVLCVKPCHAE